MSSEIPKNILLLMGVSGSGKSTIGEIVSERLGWAFEDGDALQPDANVEKMKAGIPLTDGDRQPWLARVAAWIDRERASGKPGIVACSALKRSYRRMVMDGRPEVQLVYLHGGRDLIAARLANRKGHFMPASLLQSQFDALEEPGSDECPWIVGIGPSPEEIADEIVKRVKSSGSSPPGTCAG